MNSAKYRRVNDGVSSYSKDFEYTPPEAHSWLADNLSSDLSKQPQIFIPSSHGGITLDLAHLWLPRRAFELTGSGFQPTYNFKREFSAQPAPRPLHIRKRIAQVLWFMI
ncbi:MAG TPA: hypothetical protein VFR80_14900 [Pyrinomonadaceae bacterium]|nr:hypothetical protein [Pyrinomonadaceae bacterium]